MQKYNILPALPIHGLTNMRFPIKAQGTLLIAMGLVICRIILIPWRSQKLRLNTSKG
jgi:hypothetical protein